MQLFKRVCVGGDHIKECLTRVVVCIQAKRRQRTASTCSGTAKQRVSLKQTAIEQVDAHALVGHVQVQPEAALGEQLKPGTADQNKSQPVLHRNEHEDALQNERRQRGELGCAGLHRG